MRILTAMISLLLISLLMFPILAFAAEQPIHLFLNGKQLATEVSPRIVKGNTVVPVRVIAESLGSKVQWEEKTRKVTVDKDQVNIQLFINKQEATVNNKKYQLETAPSIVEGSTMLPLRFVSEQMGVKVVWDDLTRSVFLFNSDKDTKGTESGAAQDDAPSKPVEKPEPAEKPEPTVKPELIDNPEAVDKPKPEEKPESIEKPKPEEKPGKQQGPTTISSISLDGDQFSVHTSGAKVTPKVTYSTDNKSISIDFPNSQLASNLKLGAGGEGIVKENHPSVSQIRYLLFSKDSSIVRIIVDLSKTAALKQAAANPANSFKWTLTWEQPPAKDRYVVVIDPGHGGDDTGAVSVTKRYEKDFVLSLGTKIAALLEKEPKIQVFMTRKDDTFIELADRAAFANDRNADLFVSVHGNSAGKVETAHGVETYYYTDQSLAFANLMHKQMLKGTGFLDRKVKQSGFYVVKNTTMPSLLLEVGFLSNPEDEEAMFQDAFQNRVAASIVTAIKQQLNID